MGLGRLAENALALEKEGGGSLCQLLINQYSLPYVAASTAVRYTVSPPQESYAAILVRFEVIDAYARAFDLEVHSLGLPTLNCLLMGNESFDVWQLVTGRDQFWASLTNQDNVPHPFTSRNSYLIFDSQPDLALTLDKLEVSAKDSIEAQAIKELQKQMKQSQQFTANVIQAILTREVQAS